MKGQIIGRDDVGSLAGQECQNTFRDDIEILSSRRVGLTQDQIDTFC